MNVMHSERIEHNVDGAINFQMNENAKYINQANVIKEELEENESVHNKDDSI